VFTVMTWNLENLFAPAPADQADFDAKVDALAGVVSDVQPDLLGVQEVGDESSFSALCSRLGAPWTGVLSTHFDSSHTIRVGWLSRRPLTDVDEVVDLPAALSPVTVADDGTRTSTMGRGLIDHVLVSHALSRRLQEARTVPLDVPSMGEQPRLSPRPAGRPPSDHRPVVVRFDL
jgi:endonuclease/exonuclease/phosphatase family metal-dependent hydrolase